MSENEHKKPRCAGCTENYYNSGGNSTTGECWSLEKAQLVTRYRIEVWTRPTEPGAFTETQVYDCRHEKGYALYEKLPSFVRDEDVNKLEEKEA